MSISFQSSPRDRLIETARTLFLQDGIQQTGINAVIAQADIARMTLYNNFASKDELILAVFEREAAARRDVITKAQEKLSDPIERILALFDVAEELASRKGFRGCAFINLAIEVAAPDGALHQLAKAHKTWIHENIHQNLIDIAKSDPDSLARQICILWDGSIVGAYIHQTTEPIISARNAAVALIKAAAA